MAVSASEESDIIIEGPVLKSLQLFEVPLIAVNGGVSGFLGFNIPH